MLRLHQGPIITYPLTPCPKLEKSRILPGDLLDHCNLKAHLRKADLQTETICSGCHTDIS